MLAAVIVFGQAVDTRLHPPSNAGEWLTIGLNVISMLVAIGILGALSDAFLAAIERARESIDAAEAVRQVSNQQWERLFLLLTADHPVSLSAAGSNSGHSQAQREAIEAVRQAVQRHDWEEANRFLDSLKSQDLPGPEIERLEQEIADRRNDHVARKLEQLQASREVNDSETVLTTFQEVGPLLEATDRKPLEEDLARWFMSQIQRRLRGGSIQPDVVTLITRVTEIFGATIEGASLRAGLPTLRRAVGLCPRCGGPYLGVGDACTDCLERQHA